MQIIARCRRSCFFAKAMPGNAPSCLTRYGPEKSGLLFRRPVAPHGENARRDIPPLWPNIYASRSTASLNTQYRRSGWPRCQNAALPLVRQNVFIPSRPLYARPRPTLVKLEKFAAITF